MSSAGGDSAVLVSRGASYLTLQLVVTSVAQALSFAVLARIITPSQVGILAILSLITALAQAVNGGAFQQASMKFVGQYAGTDNGLAAGVFYQTLKLSLIVAVPFAIVVFFGAGYLATVLVGTVSEAGLFRVLAADVLIFAGVLPAAMGAVLGAKRFRGAAMIGTCGAVLRQCLIILLIILLKNFVGLVYAWVVSDFAMFVAYAVFASRVLGLGGGSFPMRKLVSFTWPLSVGNFAGFLYSWFDRALLIVFVPLASLGVYNAALIAFGAASGISNAFGNALTPVYAEIGGGRGLERCRKATMLATRYVSLVTVPVAFGLLAVAKPALTLFVGQAYVGGVVPLMILSLAFGLSAFGLALSPMLTALGKTRQALLITLISVLCALGSAYVLLPLMGIAGASVARDVATFASLILTVYVLKRIQVMRVDIEMTWKSLVAGALMATVIVVVQMVIYSKLLLPFYIVLGGVVYLLLLRVLRAVRRHDIELIQKFLGPRLGFASRLLGTVLIPRAGEPTT